MNLDDAYYHLLLLESGLDDGYDDWLDGYLAAEDPLSDIVLDLALCGSDLNRTISCLWGYCGCWPEVDERLLCERLRNYLKQMYHSGKMDKRAVVDAMHRIASAHGDPGDFDFDLWGDLYYMDDHYSLAADGIISWEVFDRAFEAFLNDGISVESTVWRRAKKPSVLDRIKGIFQH